MTPAPALDLTTSLRGDFTLFLRKSILMWVGRGGGGGGEGGGGQTDSPFQPKLAFAYDSL